MRENSIIFYSAKNIGLSKKKILAVCVWELLLAPEDNLMNW